MLSFVSNVIFLAIFHHFRLVICRTCFNVEDKLVMATPAGLVHSKDFIRKVLV